MPTSKTMTAAEAYTRVRDAVVEIEAVAIAVRPLVAEKTAHAADFGLRCLHDYAHRMLDDMRATDGDPLADRPSHGGYPSGGDHA